MNSGHTASPREPKLPDFARPDLTPDQPPLPPGFETPEDLNTELFDAASEEHSENYPENYPKNYSENYPKNYPEGLSVDSSPSDPNEAPNLPTSETPPLNTQTLDREFSAELSSAKVDGDRLDRKTQDNLNAATDAYQSGKLSEATFYDIVRDAVGSNLENSYGRRLAYRQNSSKEKKT